MPVSGRAGSRALRGGHVRTARTLAQYDVYIALVKAAEELNRDFTELLKPQGLSMAQYNVLRILRGADHEVGLSCGEVAERLIRHDPDITRLFDRLEQRQLVARTRDVGDRRVVRTRITQAGLDLLEGLDVPVDQMHERQLGHLTEAKLRELQDRVAEARARP